MKITVFLIQLLILPILLFGCKSSDYPYYIKVRTPELAELKPVFIILIDASGSNSAYIPDIKKLAEDSKSYLLKNLYNEDEETMNERFFVTEYPDGEKWTDVMITKPSQLILGASSEIDNHENRIIIFYGNGVGVSNAIERDKYYSGVQNFINNEYSSLNFYLSRLVITPGSDLHYTDWAKCVIENYQYLDEVDPFNPPMKNYGWGYTLYDPSTIGVENFLDDIIESIKAEYNE